MYKFNEGNKKDAWQAPFFMYYFFRLSSAAGSFFVIAPSFSQESMLSQPPHVTNPFSLAHRRIGQSVSQYGVFAPSTRQPVQFIISAVIETPLSFDQRSATLRRWSSSLFAVAILASHFEQSIPQYAMYSFIFASVKNMENISCPALFYFALQFFRHTFLHCVSSAAHITAYFPLS